MRDSSERLTGSGRADAGVFALDRIDLDVEHGLLDATAEHVSCEADYLLRTDERVRQVIRHRAQALVAEHGELIEPRVVNEAGIAQPIHRELRVERIRDDRRNDADLQTGEDVIPHRKGAGE